jgi:ribose transport system substrate-binding protein
MTFSQLRRAAAVGALALVAALVAATATPGAPRATGAAKKPVLVAFANLLEGDATLTSMRQTIVELAKKRGWKTLTLNNNLDGPTALKNADTMINRKVTYAIEFQADASVQPVLMSKFNKARIPVVAIDIAAPGAYFLGAPNVKSGNQAGIALGTYAKRNWACNPDLVMLLDAPIAGTVSQLRVDGVVNGLYKVCPNLAAKKGVIVRKDGGGTPDSALPVARDILTANPDAKRILVGGINDSSVTGAINAAEQLGRAEELYAWGQDGGVLTSGKASPKLAGSVLYFLEGYAVYIYRDVLDKLAAGQRVPIGDSPAHPSAILVDSCSVTAAQAAKIPPIATRVKKLLASPAGTTMADLYCPKPAKP